ncbi:recombinase family protein [Clostridium sp. C8-1-8]|uniref:recombinase family protein n=1 Tax=Clostridium sp. C8-1-8 TaxID=2698831 RepID=UPI00136827EB|nr:recombinase family protein [Clostridium sp. C8-1-8]
MKVNDFIQQISKEGYNTENVFNSEIYKKIKDDDVSVGIYSRISRDVENDISIERQVSTMTRFITNIGLKSGQVKIYVDDGASGTNPNRPGYVSLINDALANKINVVIVVRIDRFGRSFYHIYNTLYDIFYKSSTLFLSINDKLINTESEVMEILEEGLIAEKYAKKVSRDVKDALKERMLDGTYIGGGLYGYKVLEQEGIDENGFKQRRRALLINSDGSSDVIRKIFSLYLSGQGYEKIANQLQSNGIVSPTGEKIWWGNTIKMILVNPLYGGLMAQGRYRKHNYLNKKVSKTRKEDWIISNEFEGIVSKEIYIEVQKQMEVRKEKYRYKADKPHILCGIMRCGECGKTLIYKGNGNYKCLGSQDGSGCSTHLIKENEMLNIISIKLKNFSIDEESMFNRLVDNYERINNIKRIDRLIDSNDREIVNFRKKIIDCHSQKFDGKMDEETYEFLLYQYQQSIQDLKRRNNDLAVKKDIIPIVKGKFEEVYERYKNFELIDNSILRLLIKEIKVYQYKGIEILWNIKR